MFNSEGSTVNVKPDWCEQMNRQYVYGKSFSQANRPNKKNLDRHQWQETLNKNQWHKSNNLIISTNQTISKLIRQVGTVKIVWVIAHKSLQFTEKNAFQ